MVYFYLQFLWYSTFGVVCMREEYHVSLSILELGTSTWYSLATPTITTPFCNSLACKFQRSKLQFDMVGRENLVLVKFRYFQAKLVALYVMFPHGKASVLCTICKKSTFCGVATL